MRPQIAAHIITICIGMEQKLFFPQFGNVFQFSLSERFNPVTGSLKAGDGST